jgi:HEAT repeat protein
MTARANLVLLLEQLGHKEAMERVQARSDLIACGAAAVEPLIHILQSGSFNQVSGAISVLAAIGDSRAIEPLIQMLHASHSLFRMGAAEALSAFDDSRTVEALLEILHDEDELVQMWAVTSLGTLGKGACVEPLIALLNETSSAQIRYTVIRALGKLGDCRAVHHIQRYLDDPNHHVQREAKMALEKLR